MSVNLDNNGLDYDPWSEDEDDVVEEISEPVRAEDAGFEMWLGLE